MDPSGGIVPYVVGKIGDLLISEIALLANTRRDLEWVQRELRMMQAVLEHVATMKIQDARITIWIEDVRRLAFHAEDVVDTFSLHAGNPTRKSFLSCCILRTKSRHDFGTEIAQLRESVAELSRMRDTYGIDIPYTKSSDTVDRTDELLQLRRLTATPYVEDRDVVGLDGHVKAVTDLLVREGSRRSVISIVGMGGLGKTTLAKKVYNNMLRSSSSFDCTTWVDVSQKYSILDLLQRIAREILKMSENNESEMNQDSVTAKLCGVLQSKKYLVVLDDVWTSELWDTLDTILPDPNNGSRILITTRNMEVARSANPLLSPYELSVLGEEESRVLFTKKVFPSEENPEQCCTVELARLREQIIKQCGGLPLAIIVVGGLLSRKEKTPAVWRNVAEKIDWHQTEKGERCMGILALSYIDLPAHLRWCFLYLASLPEDCEAFAGRLQRLWIAEGFIEDRVGVSMEDTAERYFEELVQRCLIQAVERNQFGFLGRYCRVHDLLLDLAVSEAKRIRFLDVWRNPSVGTSAALLRRLSFHAEKTIPHLPLESNHLRTLLIMEPFDWERGESSGFLERNHICHIEWSSLQRNLKLLRVLELAIYVDNLPAVIGDMVNLRYLTLSNDGISYLPETLGNLRHLQTLDVGMTEVKFLPNSIWRIKTLRYLRGSICTRLPKPKDSLPDDTFKNMRALRCVHADPWMEAILPNLINLRELEVSYVDNVSMTTYLSRTIKKLQWLHVLILDVRSTSADNGIFEMDEIFLPTDSHKYLLSLQLRGLLIVPSHIGRLPQNLTEVSLAKTKINHKILELVGNLKFLRTLRLSDISFTEDEMVFNSGWFPRLHVLVLHDLDIKRWELEELSLPLLRELSVIRCSHLEMLPEGLQHINTLRAFTLRAGPLILHEKLQRPEGEEKREGEDWYKIKHIERVDIY